MFLLYQLPGVEQGMSGHRPLWAPMYPEHHSQDPLTDISFPLGIYFKPFLAHKIFVLGPLLAFGFMVMSTQMPTSLIYRL